MKPKDTIILALDGMRRAQVIDLVLQLKDRVYALKIHDLYDRCGPTILKELKQYGSLMWVDFKLHDIPNTVRLRAQALRDNGADIITVHAAGGIPMMEAALESGADIYAITALTSLSTDDIAEQFGRTPAETVFYYATQAKKAGVHGVVCSGQEVEMLVNHPDTKDLDLIVPGTRSPGTDIHDQERIATPYDTVKAGARRLVIGRQVTAAKNPLEALRLLEEEIPEKVGGANW